MDSSLLLALITGLWYWFAASLAGYTLFSTLKSPTFIGFILGLICGEPVKGVIAGGSIEVIYLGLVSAGGNIPSDKALAGLIAIPVVLQTDISTQLAISIAVPIGIIGVFINNIRRFGNAFLIHKADAYAETGNYKGIWHAATLYSFIFGFIIRFPIVFVANYYGSDLINSFLQIIPRWLIHGLEVMGGLLPALGFATTIFIIGRKELIPVFILAYFLVVFSGLSIIGAAIFGGCLACIFMNLDKLTDLVKTSYTQPPSSSLQSNQEAIKKMLRGKKNDL